MRSYYLLVIPLLAVTLSIPVSAVAHESHPVLLDEFVAGITVPNARNKVLALSRLVASNKVTVEEFADYYFLHTADGKASPQLRRRFITNMRQNLRIVNRAGRGVPAADAIRAERSIEIVLFRLQRTVSGNTGILPHRSSANRRLKR